MSLSDEAAAASYTGAGLFDGRHRLVDAVHELADVLEVSGHLCSQNHVDDGLPQSSVLIPVGRTAETIGDSPGDAVLSAAAFGGLNTLKRLWMLSSLQLGGFFPLAS